MGPLDSNKIGSCKIADKTIGLGLYYVASIYFFQSDYNSIAVDDWVQRDDAKMMNFFAVVKVGWLPCAP